MSDLSKPVYVATIAGQPLRFFRTPNNDGRPDLPWHSVEDLHRCLGFDRAQRRVFLNMLRKRGGIKTVATADGIVTVAPHYMAQGCIDATVEDGMAPSSIRDDYDHAGAEALRKVIPPRLEFPGDDAFLDWMKEAMHRHEKVRA